MNIYLHRDQIKPGILVVEGGRNEVYLVLDDPYGGAGSEYIGYIHAQNIATGVRKQLNIGYLRKLNNNK